MTTPKSTQLEKETYSPTEWHEKEGWREDDTLSRVYSTDPPKAPCWYCGAEGYHELDCQLFEDDEIGF